MAITFLQIPITPTVQEYIYENKEITEKDLVRKFNEFLETEFIINNLKTAFKELKEYKNWNLELQDAREFLKEFND